jgi:hypothetical protein
MGIPAYGIYYLVDRAVKRKKEIAQGEKKVLTGIVTDKKIEVHTSTSSSKTGSSTRTTYTYYIYFGERKFEVDVLQYNEIIVNQTVIVHYAPLTEEVIYLEQPTTPRPKNEKSSLPSGDIESFAKDLFSGNITPTNTTINNETLKDRVDKLLKASGRNTVQKTEANDLTEEDIAHLKLKRTNTIQRFMLLFVLLMVSIIVLRYAGDSDFVFFSFLFLPVYTIYVIYKFFTTIRTWLRINKDLYKQKKLTFSTIDNKESYQYNGGTKTKSVMVGYKSIAVNDALYDSLKTGDAIIIHETASGFLLGIETENDGMIYEKP